MRAALPSVRSKATSILNQYGIASHDYVGEAKAIGHYVQQNVRYVKDANGVEQLTDPLTMIDQMGQGISRGDCDDMALLIATLLLAIGHDPAFRCVRYDSFTGPFNHIYVVDYPVDQKLGKIRVVLDAIVKNQKIGFEVKHMSGSEYKA